MSSENQIIPKRIIETDEFPFEFLSELAEKESWRKEIFRPIYHVHKWWAKRLGSIFRGIVLGAFAEESVNFKSEFYKKQQLREKTVFDPFMGSGTTIGEAYKLGCTALGRDINPIAAENVRIALGPVNKEKLFAAFEKVEDDARENILKLYKSRDSSGNPCDVLYWFWVKTIPCTHCSKDIDLFPTRIISRNAYPDRKPEIQVCCPKCNDIFVANSKDKTVSCKTCDFLFDPSVGNTKGASAFCPHCSNSFKIIENIRKNDLKPSQRMYAKLVLTSSGEKQYLKVDSMDLKAFQDCEVELASRVSKGQLKIPVIEISDGNNTKQALNYNYKQWSDFFNSRQLLALGILQKTIIENCEEAERDILLNVFSSVLEFNNMFASYKGEGTGAVRHMFSHHILKPEKLPIEANVWGTSKSSGSFSTLFKSKINRLLDYREKPFEIHLKEGKNYNSSRSFNGELTPHWEDVKYGNGEIYLSCGSSDKTNLKDRSVDAIVTDPPFFDNVHYSELADFFFAWQSLYPHGFIDTVSTTRHSQEVQDKDSNLFSGKLRNVFLECERVLKDDGLMIFTYHHSRQEGWDSVSKALFYSGFIVTNVHPVKAEMSSATPKSQSKEPIQLDVIVVCKKKNIGVKTNELYDFTSSVKTKAKRKAKRLTSVGLNLSVGDCKVIAFSQLLSEISFLDNIENIEEILRNSEQLMSELALEIHDQCNLVQQVSFNI
ncbi:hypothetical protein ACIFOE_03745 [Paenibacillus sp. NRS-1783]|uniref:hypothetical protein n=1 Tax=Paenibacillus sp. NRS-1783 TaxID=3233907 RepID=UPI003D29F177